MFDTEQFRIQCSDLTQCQTPREVLTIFAKTWADLCQNLRVVQDLHDCGGNASLNECARQLVTAIFSVSRALLKVRRPPRDFIKCCNKLCTTLFSWIWPPQGKWCRTAAPVQQIFGALTMLRSLLWLHSHSHTDMAKQVGRMMPSNIRVAFWNAPLHSHVRHIAIDSLINMIQYAV